MILQVSSGYDIEPDCIVCRDVAQRHVGATMAMGNLALGHQKPLSLFQGAQSQSFPRPIHQLTRTLAMVKVALLMLAQQLVASWVEYWVLSFSLFS